MENGQEPATKQDLAHLHQQLHRDIEQLGSATRQELEQLRSESHHGFDDLKETMRDGQTELLKAFYSFAQSTDAKLKDSELTDIVLRQRLTAVELRLTEIEKRINLPPAA
ncbi:MAG: hypothetical protein JWP63_5242 [Candidatus Solibacter sp.]|jgi:ElaB/YqjD/DUF883 family membrane-anchored ribosome-binding protein|nr:hypothetical protein [Candidatus Solibacter sp.]